MPAAAGLPGPGARALLAAALLASAALAQTPCTSTEYCAGRTTQDGATCSDGVCTACNANSAPSASYST